MALKDAVSAGTVKFAGCTVAVRDFGRAIDLLKRGK